MKTPYTYTVAKGDETQKIEGRTAAVRRARELSRTSHRPVRVEREDDRMMMVWRRGNLQKYRLETR